MTLLDIPARALAHGRNRQLAKEGKRWCTIGPDGKGHVVGLLDCKGKDGTLRPNSYCMQCDKVRQHARIYGKTIPEAWQWFEESQICEIGGQCSGAIVQDHDHKTKTLRGPLCSAHNAGLGQFHDSQNELRSAIEYLSRWEYQEE